MVIDGYRKKKVSPAMAKKPSKNVRFRGTSLPQGLANAEGYAVGIYHGFPKTKELTTPREIPEQQKKRFS